MRMEVDLYWYLFINTNVEWDVKQHTNKHIFCIKVVFYEPKVYGRVSGVNISRNNKKNSSAAR